MEQLVAYLADKKQGDFCTRLGISEPYLSQLKHGTRRPSLDLALEIERVTEGEIMVYDWARK